MTHTHADVARVGLADRFRRGLLSLFRRKDPAELLAVKAGRTYALRRFRFHLVYLIPAAIVSVSGLAFPAVRGWPLWWTAVCAMTVAALLLAGTMAYWIEIARRAWSPQAVELCSRDAELMLYPDEPAGRANREIARFVGEIRPAWPIRVYVRYPHGVRVPAGKCTDMTSLTLCVARTFSSLDRPFGLSTTPQHRP